MPKNKLQRHPRGVSALSAPPQLTTLPDWPQFKPPLPVVDLVPELHPLTPKIATIPFFFPKSLCRDYVTFLKTLPLQTTPGKPKRGEAVRVNDRFQIDDPAFATRLWETTGLKEALLDNQDVKGLWPLPSEEIAVSLETGTLLLHKHGDDCLLHEGREVKAGEKWVLRTDLCIKR
ncbi:hypothetical protein EsHS_00000507 [Epichloe bromicola]